MTNNNSNMQGKIEKVDFCSALEDGLMTCLEHEKDLTQITRLVSLLTTARELMAQDDDVPPKMVETKKENVTAEYALRAAEQYRQYHRAFCEGFVRELIQRHVYTAQNSEEWECLNNQKEELTSKIKTCNDLEELKSIIRSRDSVMRNLETILIYSIYFGALQDNIDYPETLDEFRCMFDNGMKPSWERFDMGLRTLTAY